jgi:hypothetical protein
MSNVLLVDTNFSSGPIYQFDFHNGYSVTVVGGKSNDAYATWWMWSYNYDHPDMTLGRFTPKQKLAMAA